MIPWFDAVVRRIRAAFDRPHFRRVVTVAELHDVPEHIGPHDVYIAGAARPKWIALLCPCPRPHRVVLSLQSTHQHAWRVFMERGFPTVVPSVDVYAWRRCHYVIRAGRVRWVSDEESPIEL